MAEVAVEQPFNIDSNLKKVMALPSKYKTAIYLYYYEGYSTIEIAEILKKTHPQLEAISIPVESF
jgi:DNA-directed RNA polymerase specialized sigma24 family protein